MSEFRILVPLDGSKLSESSLLLIPFLKGLGSVRLRFVGVWEAFWQAPNVEESARMDEQTKEFAEKGRAFLEAYLEGRCKAAREAGVEAEFSIRLGRAAEETLQEAKEWPADLILIATHGRSGVERFRLGSVADKVIRGAECPVLVIGPNVRTQLTGYQPRRLMVPLDGSEMAELALPLAIWIAKRTGAGLDLVRATTITPMAAEATMGAYPVDMLRLLEEAAEAYLAKTAAAIEGPEVKTAAVTGLPSEELLRYLDANPIDLVVITSHCRGGILRFALGSVADRLLHGPAPVLVIRPEDMGGASRLLAAAREG
jgi:nucleotide-binding universal stress UspA family protein